MFSLKKWQPPGIQCHLCQFDISPGVEPFTYPTDRPPRTTIECHPNCARLVPEQWLHAVSLISASAHEPPLEEVKRRVSWLRSNLASNLTLSRELPIEIKEIIAQHLVCEYAVLKTTNCCFRLLRPTDICVDVSAEVWVRYAEFEGIKYVSDLTNHPNPGEGYESILVPDPVQPVDRIYVSEDHLGIRQMCFSCGTVPPAAPTPGVWWWTLQPPSSEAKVYGKTDGVKLRDTGCFEPVGEPHFTNAAYEFPLPPTANIRWHYLRGWDPSYRGILVSLRVFNKFPLRMASFKCNDATVTGYSICWNGQPMYIHAHTKGEDLSFYNSPRYERGIWLYMPLCQDEFLVDIWLRQRQRRSAVEFSLVFQTNKGQIMMAGPQPRLGNPPSTWLHLDTLKNVPGRIFFNDSPFGFSKLGLETLRPIPGKDAVALNLLSPSPHSTTSESYFYSTASLDDVVEIRPCCLKAAGISAIIGLVIRYADGRQTSVGEVRLDLVEDSIRIDRSEKMTLRFSAIDGCPYVASIHFSSVYTTDTDQSTLMDVHWTGYLEWGFSQWRCKIYHNGQASPETVPEG